MHDHAVADLTGELRHLGANRREIDRRHGSAVRAARERRWHQVDAVEATVDRQRIAMLPVVARSPAPPRPVRACARSDGRRRRRSGVRHARAPATRARAGIARRSGVADRRPTIARWVGERGKATATAVPSSIDEVESAAGTSGRNGSCEVSVVQAPSNPTCSADAAAGPAVAASGSMMAWTNISRRARSTGVGGAACSLRASSEASGRSNQRNSRSALPCVISATSSSGTPGNDSATSFCECGHGVSACG